MMFLLNTNGLFNPCGVEIFSVYTTGYHLWLLTLSPSGAGRCAGHEWNSGNQGFWGNSNFSFLR
jgi:hypothetical protein